MAVENFDEALNGIDEEDSISSHSSFSCTSSDENPWEIHSEGNNMNSKISSRSVVVKDATSLGRKVSNKNVKVSSRQVAKDPVSTLRKISNMNVKVSSQQVAKDTVSTLRRISNRKVKFSSRQVDTASMGHKLSGKNLKISSKGVIIMDIASVGKKEKKPTNLLTDYSFEGASAFSELISKIKEHNEILGLER